MIGVLPLCQVSNNSLFPVLALGLAYFFKILASPCYAKTTLLSLLKEAFDNVEI